MFAAVCRGTPAWFGAAPRLAPDHVACWLAAAVTWQGLHCVLAAIYSVAQSTALVAGQQNTSHPAVMAAACESASLP